MGVRSFQELLFWQKARTLSKEIFRITKQDPFRQDSRLVRQINDSSESVMANVAEGFGRGTQGEFVTFLGYALGSLDETRSHLCAAYDREYFDRERFGALFEQGTEIRKMMVAFIRSMVKHGSGVKHMRPVRSWTDEVWEVYERVTGQQRPPLFQQNQQEDH